MSNNDLNTIKLGTVKEAIQKLENNYTPEQSVGSFAQNFANVFTTTTEYLKSYLPGNISSSVSNVLNPMFDYLKDNGSKIKNVNRILYFMCEKPAEFGAVLAVSLAADAKENNLQAAMITALSISSAQEFANRNLSPTSQFLLMLAAANSLYSLAQAATTNSAQTKDSNIKSSLSASVVEAATNTAKKAHSLLSGLVYPQEDFTTSNNNLDQAAQTLLNSDPNAPLGNFVQNFTAVYSAATEYLTNSSAWAASSKIADLFSPLFDLLSTQDSKIINLSGMADLICLQPAAFATALAVNMATQAKELDFQSAMVVSFLVNSAQKFATRSLTPASQLLLVIAASKCIYSLAQAYNNRETLLQDKTAKPTLSDKVVASALNSKQNASEFVSFIYKTDEVPSTNDDLSKAVEQMQANYSPTMSKENFAQYFENLCSSAQKYMLNHSPQEAASKFGTILKPWFELLRNNGSDIRDANSVILLISTQPVAFAAMLALNMATKGKEFDLQSPMMATFIIDSAKQLANSTLNPVSAYLISCMLASGLKEALASMANIIAPQKTTSKKL